MLSVIYGWGGHSSKRTFVEADIRRSGHSSKMTLIKADIHLLCTKGRHSSTERQIVYYFIHFYAYLWCTYSYFVYELLQRRTFVYREATRILCLNIVTLAHKQYTSCHYGKSYTHYDIKPGYAGCNGSILKHTSWNNIIKFKAHFNMCRVLYCCEGGQLRGLHQKPLHQLDS